ncbi:MAG TPA: hypothetical protein VHQ89_14430 [Gaiellaceae bacterium]|nr:hypothetical protein [Gaiellaceae bacterium]
MHLLVACVTAPSSSCFAGLKRAVSFGDNAVCTASLDAASASWH